MENLVEIFANTLDAILGIVFLTMILGKKKSMRTGCLSFWR